MIRLWAWAFLLLLPLASAPNTAAPGKPLESPSAARPASVLTPERAADFAGLALACLDRPYPYKTDKVFGDARAVRAPRLDHPAFYGCFDWHSAVHGHWMLVRLARLFPDAPFAPRARRALAPHFSVEAMSGEAALVGEKDQLLFERPYGWAWTLRLAQELHAWDDPEARAWAKNIAALERTLADRVKDYLTKLPHPMRTGIHGNTAFAMSLALDHARATRNTALANLIVRRAGDFYGADQNCPLEYEPGGEDFFSPCLMEADLMRRVLPGADFARWLDQFLPGLRGGGLGPLERPAVVTDPADGRIVHLDGLNLSRAWCMRGVASALPVGDPRRTRLIDAARVHAEAGLARVASGHYEGEHWLASFAVFLLTDAGLDAR